MIATMNMTTYSHFRKRTRCKVLSHSDFIFAKLVYFLLLCDNFVFLYANFISMATTSVSRKLKELDNLREDIKATAGLKDKTLSPNDFDFIETDIKKKLPKSAINAKTLKRLFGYDQTRESSSIRLYTLDVLSKYVGFDNWNDYLERVRLLEGSGSGNFNGNQINADDMKIGDTLQIEWLPNRKSTLKYIGNQCFEITETENSKWQVGDTFLCKHFIVGKPLYVDNLTDKNGKLKSAMYVVGERGGITVR